MLKWYQACFVIKNSGFDPSLGHHVYKKKINRVLYIVRDDGLVVYSPPHFIKIHNRKELQDLADSMLPPELKHIIAFETKKRL